MRHKARPVVVSVSVSVVWAAMFLQPGVLRTYYDHHTLHSSAQALDAITSQRRAQIDAELEDFQS